MGGGGGKEGGEGKQLQAEQGHPSADAVHTPYLWRHQPQGPFIKQLNHLNDKMN